MNTKNIIRDTLNESVKLPIEIGDTVYMGKFKNKKTVVKTIEWNEKGDLMINGKSALRVRIPKKAKKKKLKESDDLQWMDDVEINPFEEYDYIIFDGNPSREHVSKLIDMAISTGRGDGNASLWGKEEREDDIDYLLSDSPVFGFEGDDLVRDDSDDGTTWRQLNGIRYSELYGSDTITEEDDWGWVRDVEPTYYDKKYFYRSNILNTENTTTRFGNVVNVGDKFLPPNSSTIWEVVSMEKKYESPHRNEIGISTRLKTEDGKKRHVWWEKPIEHNTPNGTFPRRKGPWQKIMDPITESDDWDWAEEIEVTFLQRLKHATENDHTINIEYRGDDFRKISDARGQNYLNKHELDVAGYGKDVTGEELLIALDDQFESIYQGEPQDNKDYREWLALLDIVQSLITTNTITESDDLDWIRDTKFVLVTPDNYKEGMRVMINENPDDYAEDEVGDIGTYLAQSGGGVGTSSGDAHADDWVRVEWDSGNQNLYPIGDEGTYSLLIV